MPTFPALVTPIRTATRARAGWAVAGCLALLAAWTGVRTVTMRTEVRLLRAEQELADVMFQSVRHQLEAERILTRRLLQDEKQQIARAPQADWANLKITPLASLPNNSPEVRGVVVWDPARQEGVLEVENLPGLPSDQDYQLWISDPRYPNPVDAGIVRVDPTTGTARVTFKPKQPVEAIEAFAVTRERRGGAARAEGPSVLQGK